MRPRTDTQTHRRAWPQYISRGLRLTRNVMTRNNSLNKVHVAATELLQQDTMFGGATAQVAVRHCATLKLLKKCWKSRGRHVPQCPIADNANESDSLHIASHLQIATSCNIPWWWHLVNAHERKPGVVSFAGKTVWSPPERFECITVNGARFLSFPFLTCFKCFMALIFHR